MDNNSLPAGMYTNTNLYHNLPICKNIPNHTFIFKDDPYFIMQIMPQNVNTNIVVDPIFYEYYSQQNLSNTDKKFYCTSPYYVCGITNNFFENLD